MNIIIYGNGGSENHGCEAIVRGTVKMIGQEENRFTIVSDSKEQDLKYGLDEIAQICEAKNEIKRNSSFWHAFLRMKVLKDYAALDVLQYTESINGLAHGTDVALSAGGDNYCYGGTKLYDYLNRAYHKAGIKTVLWGCSVEPAVTEKKEVQKDLERYNLIVARESITYSAIKKFHSNVVCAPDPAFLMEMESSSEALSMENGDYIGINISPMIVSNETAAGAARENYYELVKYILENTEYNVALIPHVVWQQNDDRTELKVLFDRFKEKDRLLLISDHSAPEIKGIIAKCKAFVGARTHATIAAYSCCIPTLVVGYSVKARGIAKDLFGTDEDYVIPVQSLRNRFDLTNAYKRIMSNEADIREHLESFIPNYKKKCSLAFDALKELKS